MTTPIPLSFVQEGWNHLQLQRPLAAWSSWQRALRLAPDDRAALQALAALESAVELPAAARAVYRFRTPDDPARRARWDDRLRSLARGQSLDDLETAAVAFAGLAGDDLSDADAVYNEALCLAWLGRNADAVARLELYVRLTAPADPDRAAQAWTLAEVLRLGSGAESLADDLRYAWAADALAVPPGLTERWPNLRKLEMPIDPLTGEKPLDNGEVFEWLDRPIPDIALPSQPPRPEVVPRVLATVIRTPHSLRLSTPDAGGLDAMARSALAGVVRAFASARREASPLPLAWADAALGTFRFPPGLDGDALAELTRSVVERYFETIWVHRPRNALDGRTPIQAARLAAGGDATARAMLEGVVRFREQLGSRPTHALLYHGYPFDRLRRRLGLIPPESTGAVDPDDVACFSEAELDALDPAALDQERLADAFAAASGFLDDVRTARFASELARREPSSLARVDLETLFAALVRDALRDGDPQLALKRLGRARELARGPAERRTFATWAAEVEARSGQAIAALESYQSVLSDLSPADAALAALDGAETLVDNGATGPALTLLIEARALARAAGDPDTLARADALLDAVEP